jgi:hypothetical protein
MNDQTGWFIDDENRFILEEDIERDGFGHSCHRRWRRNVELNTVAGPESCPGFRDKGVKCHVPAVDKFLEMRAGEGRMGVL